ncbi:hypothetical protein [Nocardia vaccinii]|uniref:hypothetical protein n=1 Tax=Nocardia vaccinii TaxID=1822 RepID=UPI000ABB2359|nr:hypothetical protein [Nocardia vaccinii]
MTSGTPTGYQHWTRLPVVYLPVYRRGALIGCLWASPNQHAAGFERRLAVAGADLDCLIAWETRLTESAATGLTPRAAIERWIGAPEDTVAGIVPAQSITAESPSLTWLWEQLNPDGPPLGEGPLIQDGTYPDGTPVDREQGWGPLVSAPLESYPSETDAPVRYLPVRLNSVVVGYVWAAVTDDAAGYLPRAQAGRTGEIAAGLWQLRFSDAYRAGQPATDALRRLPGFAADRLSGIAGPGAAEDLASGLTELRRRAAAATTEP